MHEAGNCELHEIQQRTNKVQCQRCCSYIEAGFQVCPCGGKLDMSEEVLSSIRQKIMQLIVDAYMTFQGTRGARHGAQPWQKHHFLAKEFMRTIGKKGIFSLILDRVQNDEVFHASQLQHNWTKEWCEYLDYVRTIEVTHNASPEQLERYAALYHFRYDPKQVEKGLFLSRPDYHQTTRAIVSMNTAGQIQKIKKTTQLSRGSGLREARLARMALTHLEMVLRGKPNLRLKFHTVASPKINRSACLGKPRSIHSWWSVESKLVDHVLVGEIKMDMERRSLRIFLDSGFRTHVVATTVCATGGVHTLRVARTVSFCTFSLRGVQTRTRMPQGICSAHVISLHIAYSVLMFHPPSLLFPHCHFDTTFPSAPSSSSFTRPKNAGHAHLRTCAGEFGYLAEPTHLKKENRRPRGQTMYGWICGNTCLMDRNVKRSRSGEWTN